MSPQDHGREDGPEPIVASEVPRPGESERPEADALGRGVWLVWALPPLLALLAMGIATVWLTAVHPHEWSVWSIQQDWFLELNRQLSVLPDFFWAAWTEVGETQVLLLVLSLVVVARPQVLVSILLTTPIAFFVSRAWKALADVPRPAQVLDPASFSTIGPVLTARNSFPSGHAVTAIAAAVAILMVLVPVPRGWRQWIGVLATFAMATTICLSRIAVGAHWPLDLVLGAAIGWLSGLCGAAVAARWNWPWYEHTIARQALAAVLLVGSLSVLLLSSPPTAGARAALWVAVLCGFYSGLHYSGLQLIKAGPPGDPIDGPLRQ